MSAETLAGRANCSRCSAQAAINKLIKVGFINRESLRKFQKDAKAHKYTLNTQPIKFDGEEIPASREYAYYNGGWTIYCKLFPDGEARARHFRIPDSWLRYPALLTLTPVARCILFNMYSLYYPNVPAFKYSINLAKIAGQCSNETAKNALNELMEKGWIAKADDGLWYLQSYGDGTPNCKKNGFKKWSGK